MFYCASFRGEQKGQHMPGVDTRVAAIFRKDRPIIPKGDTIIEADDEVFFIAATRETPGLLSLMAAVGLGSALFGRLTKPKARRGLRVLG